MTEQLRIGDRVKVELEGVVSYLPTSHDARYGIKNHSEETAMAYRESITKVKPPLPTAFGSVVEVEGVKYLLDGQYWYCETRGGNMTTISSRMAERDYIVLRDGI